MMRQRRPLCALGLAAVLAATGWTPAAFAADIVIGAGIGAKVHYEVGRAICRHVRRTLPGTTCEAIRIEGRHAAEPLAVLSDVHNNSIEVGLVQSDWQHHAVQGTGPVAFMDVKFDNLRSLFSVHGEPFTVVARRDAGIESLDDLAGKRVNIGNPGSSQRVMMELVMKAKGWTRKTFDLADELNEAEQSLALCHNRVQAIVATVAHPNAAIAKAVDLCHAKVVEIAGAEIDALVAGNRFLAATEVPAGLYADMPAPVRTFGVTVTAVTSADIDDELAYSIARSVFDNLDDLKRLHPALGGLVPDRMMADGLSAPLHPGALRYFRERGMM